jgi:hypothetical protein
MDPTHPTGPQQPTEPTEPTGPTGPETRDPVAVEAASRYIAANANHFTREALTESLRSRGYRESDIQAAWERPVDAWAAIPAAKPSLGSAIVGVIAIVVIGVGVVALVIVGICVVSSYSFGGGVP